MPIQYSGVPIIHREFNNSNDTTTIEGLKDSLVLAGWTLVQSLSATNTLPTGTNPGNTQTVTIGSIVYTFRSSINNGVPYEILLEATTADTLLNLVAAINAGAGSGTKYSSATTAHPQVTAAIVDNNLVITAIAAGTAGNNISCTESSNLPSWVANTTRQGGYILESARTPQRLRCRVKIYLGPVSNTVRVQFMNRMMTVSHTELLLSVQDGRLLKFVGNAYQFFTFLHQASTTAGTSVMGGVPYIFPHLAGNPIVNVTPGTPIEVELQNPHGLMTGATVFIADVEGVTNVNGLHVITVTGTHTLELNDTTGSGTYVEDTGTLASLGRIARCFWSQCDSRLSAVIGPCFRNKIDIKNQNSNTYQGFTINENVWSSVDQTGGGRISIPTIPTTVQWYNSQFLNLEPYLEAGVIDRLATPVIFGQLWDSILVNQNFNPDFLVTFDGRQWSCFTGPSGSWTQNGSLFLAVT